jgi:hypothetical protein
VQQNAALVQESAEAADQMAEQAQQLLESVARFKLHGEAEAQAPSAVEIIPGMPAAPLLNSTPRALRSLNP